MTQLFGIIAHPAHHSFSPTMHNAAFEATQIDARYEIFDVPPEKLGAFMSERTDIQGLSVSLPHKETVGQYLDEVDDLAQGIGAVNTVYWKNGKRCGTNTDALGFFEALKHVVPDLSDKHVLVVGGGGAARAILFKIVPMAKSVTIINRTVPKGVALAKEFKCRYGGKIEDLTTETPDIIVNTTSVGLEDQEEPELIPKDFIDPDMVIFDIVYRKDRLTKLIQDAQSVGAKTIDGKTMLLEQGFLQFELWTGKPAPREVMEKALTNHFSEGP